MKTAYKRSFAIMALAIVSNVTHATDSYNNLVNGAPGLFFQIANNQPVGQQIFLNSFNLATHPYLTNFTFQYWSPNATFAGGANVQLDIKFIKNNGTPLATGWATPGTVFYDTGFFAINTPQADFGPGNVIENISLNINDGGFNDLYDPNVVTTPLTLVNLPSTFTIVYTIEGLAGGDTFGVPVYNPPTVGTNYGSYWIDTGGTWSLLTNSLSPVGFPLQLETTPEPSVMAMGAVGAVLLARMLKKKNS